MFSACRLFHLPGNQMRAHRSHAVRAVSRVAGTRPTAPSITKWGDTVPWRTDEAIIGVAALLEAWPPKPRDTARSNQCEQRPQGVWGDQGSRFLFRWVLP